MARPSRCRRVCMEPAYHGFVPCEETDAEATVLTVDEYEVIRLVDFEKRTHEQCAAQMEISRTTVTEIYENARFKIADSLIHGKPLVIAGGHYRVCQGTMGRTCGRECKWRSSANAQSTWNRKGVFDMKIAVTYENGMIFQHFGHTSQMKIYEVENGKIMKEQVVDTAGNGHGALAGFLSGLGVDTLICGGIGGGAKIALADAGIQLYGGVSGSADEAVQNLLDGKLAYNPDVQCEHHNHGHHDHEHSGHECHSHEHYGHDCHGHEHYDHDCHGHKHHSHENHGNEHHSGHACSEDKHECAGNERKCSE